MCLRADAPPTSIRQNCTCKNQTVYYNFAIYCATIEIRKCPRAITIFPHFFSVALAISLFLCTSFDRLCVEAFSLDFDVYTMTPPNRAVFHASWNSMLFFFVERHESVARWCFFWPTIWCRYPKRAAHEFADPQYIQFWVTNYGFGIWRKLQSSDRNRNNIHNIQTIQNASNQCLLITIFLFRLLQFNYKSNTNKLVGQT